MPNFSLHPATRLLIWLLVLVAVQCLSGAALLAGLCVPLLLGRQVMRRGGKLVWRTRWLLLSLFVIFAWGVAGEPLWASDYAPTFDGLHEALTHLGRLVLVLMAVAAFLEKLSLPDLLAASHAVLGPWRRLGLDPDRGVVRLMLVLRYAETLPRPRDWKTLLDLPEMPLDEQVEIQQMPFGWRDLAAVVPVALAIVFFCLR